MFNDGSSVVIGWYVTSGQCQTIIFVICSWESLLWATYGSEVGCSSTKAGVASPLWVARASSMTKPTIPRKDELIASSVSSKAPIDVFKTRLRTSNCEI